jgi:hypothetical protein
MAKFDILCQLLNFFMKEKKEKFPIMAGQICDMFVPEDKNHAIASWFANHYSHSTKDKQLISTAKKQAVGRVYEKNNKIYLIP